MDAGDVGIRFARTRAVFFLALLSACSGETVAGNTENLGRGRGGGHGGVDAGASDAAIDEDAICTRTPDEWLEDCGADSPIHCGRGHGRCSHHPRGHGRGHLCDGAPSRNECRDLRTGSVASRELTALRINLRVNDDLEDLHFARGLEQDETLAELADTRHPDPMRVADANRAFAGCIDRGVLVPWIETPVCGGDDRGRGRDDRGRGRDRDEVSGPEGMRCMAYDSACTRGHYDEENACCTGMLLPAGTVCGSELLCDGEGTCASAASVPPGERVGGDFDWVAFFPEGVGADGLMPEQMAEVVDVLSAPNGMPAASVEIRVAARLDQLDPGIDIGPNDGPIEPTEPDGPPEEVAPYAPEVLAIVPSAPVSTERITILRSPITSPLYAMAYGGPAVPHALVFAARFQHPVTELYVVEGPLDGLPAVLSDGSTAGATLVPCVTPGDPIDDPIGDPIGDPVPGFGARCDVIDGQAVLVGSNVSLAWVPQLEDRPAFDVITGSFGNITPIGGWIFNPGGYPAPTCRTGRCTVPGGCRGTQICIGGSPSACMLPFVDPCNGIDDNCNGRIDEFSNAGCNDDIGCTLDYCALGTCRNTPLAAFCTTPLSTCAVGVCASGTGVLNVSRLPQVGDRLVPAPPGVPTGCTVIAGHGWCTSTWDSCDCNGPEQCDVMRGTTASRTNAGCFSAPVTSGTPLTIVAACDDDGDPCTAESVCCEAIDPDDPNAPDDYCRTDALLRASNPTAADRREQACDFPGGRSDTWGPVVGFSTSSFVGPVRCSRTAPFGTGAPFTDRCPADGNPCTLEICNVVTGECYGSMPSGFVPAETYIDPSSGTVTMGVDCRPSSTTEDPNSCGVPQCTAGRCGETAVDASSACQFPASCGGGMCVPGSRRSSEYPEVRDGCLPPPGMCYLPGPIGNGVADGNCVSGSVAPPAGPSNCRVCRPDLNPYDLSTLPDGDGCDDADPCTRNDRCGGGICTGICDETLSPICVGTCSPA